MQSAPSCTGWNWEIDQGWIILCFLLTPPFFSLFLLHSGQSLPIVSCNLSTVYYLLIDKMSSKIILNIRLYVKDNGSTIVPSSDFTFNSTLMNANKYSSKAFCNPFIFLSSELQYETPLVQVPKKAWVLPYLFINHSLHRNFGSIFVFIFCFFIHDAGWRKQLAVAQRVTHAYKDYWIAHVKVFSGNEASAKCWEVA